MLRPGIANWNRPRKPDMAAPDLPRRGTPSYERFLMTNAPAPSDIRIFRTSDVPATAELAPAGSGTAATGAEFSVAAVEQALAAGCPCCVILWQRPEATLSADLHAGTDPGPGLTAWQARAAAILTLFRRNRSRIVLVNSRLLVQEDCAPERLRLEQRLAQVAEIRLSPVPPADAPGGPLGALADLIAALAIPRLEALTAVLAEIEISSFTAPPPAADIAGLQAGARELACLRDAQDRAAERIALLSAQIGQMDGPLRESEAARGALQKRLAQEGKAAAAALSAQYRISAALEKRLFRESERTLHLEEENGQLRIALAGLRTESALLDADNRKLLASQSWKVTAPLRAARRALRHAPPADQGRRGDS